MRTIISFSSNGSGVGKDTAANYLSDNYGFARFSWATRLRKEIMKRYTYTPYSVHDLHIVADKDWESSNGFHQQLIHYTDKEYIFRENIKILESIKNPLITISDTRFPNEMNYLKSIKANNKILLAFIKGEHRRGVREYDQLLDLSEFDLILDNTKSLADFYRLLADLVESLV